MQKLTNGAWTTFHTMLATKEDANNLYVTYHSGGTDGLSDYVDRPLSNIATSPTTQRFLLVQLTYPNFTFADVPPYHWAWENIERLYSSSITGGCYTNPLRYCPYNTVTRAQMAVFLLRGIHGASYTPPPVGSSTGFIDVPTSHWAAAWIKQLAAEGITGGCYVGYYCPEGTATHAQMAVFLLRSKYTSAYTPPPVGSSTGFNDVPTSYWAAAWIKQMRLEGISNNQELINDGCPSGSFCPEASVTRALMAGLLVRAFELP